MLSASYLGYVTYTQSIEAANIGTIVLKQEAKELDNVVISASRSPYKMTGTTLVADVQKSILKDVGTSIDVLKQLPLVSLKNGVIKVFGKENTLIYIDNREVRNNEELQNLAAANIKKIDIITTPGARYPASVDAVIKISTLKPGEGLSGRMYTKVQKSKDWSESVFARLSYAKNNFVVLADYSLQDSRNIQDQQTSISIDGISKNLTNSTNRLRLNNKTHNFSLASEYIITENHRIGARYNQSFLKDSHYDISGTIENFSNDNKTAEYTQLSEYQPEGSSSNVNLFYSGKALGWNIDFNTDYLFGYTGTLAKYDNTEQMSRVHSIVNSDSENSYRLGAVKLELSRQIGQSLLSLGADYVKTFNNSSYENDNMDLQTDLPKTTTDNLQDLYALFLDYQTSLLDFNLNAGLRYEYVNQRYFMNDIKNEEQSRIDNSFFPTLSLSRALFDEKVMMSLSYGTSIQRPSYYQLRGDIQYNSPYSYEAGNPLLRNTYISDVSYMASYSTVSLMASYKWFRDMTVFTIEQYEDKPVTMSSFANVDGYKTFSLAAMWNPTFFGVWSPQMEAGVEKPFLTIAEGNVHKTYNSPQYYIGLNNVLNLPQNYRIVVQGRCWSAYHAGLSYEKASMYLNAYAQKSFFNRALFVTIGAEDIFDTFNENGTMAHKNVYLEKLADADNRNVFIAFTYYLHNTKAYSGKGTRNSEKYRLNTL